MGSTKKGVVEALDSSTPNDFRLLDPAGGSRRLSIVEQSSGTVRVGVYLDPDRHV